MPVAAPDSLPETRLLELRFRLRGGLYEPGEPEYADACTLFNSMIDRRPRLVARCAAPDDVIASLAFAREHGLEVAVRAGGHSVSGRSLCDDGLVLDLRGMRDVDVDPEGRVVRVGGGATWADVDPVTQVHGLATPGGRVSSTGVGGLTLGGGSGWLLHGRPAVMVAGMHAGALADGERALQEIRAFGPPAADFFAPTAYADFQRSLDDPPGYRNYWTAENVAELPDEAIDALAARAAEIPPGPSQLFIVPWGGAVRRFGAEHSPLAGREARFIVHPLLLWEDPADDERCRALGRAFRDDMRPWSIGATYPNFLGQESAARMRAAFGGSAERLAAAIADWDPEGVFRTQQRIAPRTDKRP